ncbi:transcriptional regulator, HxlR family [Streptosporangium subroseum]|uniref:Transcriptional regulator, HxlR family n=1 Tax=Streptosporangium subroseum TaxID=106412 RepID=A0A239BFZ5_9ACTN|nr:helix-turn-helix domain-containing protein [Streptosporangium subroseum]SNS06975.1 transcriptional regulator, HxlR family [Streptosporangium subroseum]
MKRTPFADWPCSIARSVDLLGDWWTPLVLREAFYGTRRFDDIQRNLRIGRNILTQRLKRLVEEGMLERVPYQERPQRYEYVLTEKGRDFFPVLAAMMHWGDKWLSPDGPPINLRHHDHDTHAEVVCAECREPLDLRDVSATLGPGFPERLRSRPDVAERFPDDSSMDQDSEIKPPPE